MLIINALLFGELVLNYIINNRLFLFNHGINPNLKVKFDIKA